MYSIIRTTHQATGVEHALTCNFFNRSEKCLIVAGANIIRVFRLIPDVDPAKREKFTGICSFLVQLLPSGSFATMLVDRSKQFHSDLHNTFTSFPALDSDTVLRAERFQSVL